MLAKIYAPAHIGLEAKLIEVECDMANSLPGMVIVGLGDKAIDEARERVKRAIKNSDLIMPRQRLTLNLAPADLPKDGTAYDLAMAIAILVASQQVEKPETSIFIGELALDGSLRPVRGALAAAQLAADTGQTSIFVPQANAEEASLAPNIRVYPVGNLRQLYRHLVGEEAIKPFTPSPVNFIDVEPTTNLSSIYGQEQAKRAVEIAAAGGHNLLLSGPPGAGKTLLAKALPGILPPPSPVEAIEIMKLRSLAGLAHQGLPAQRPFRSPHHTASYIALTGGGKLPRPGEISLSHRGVLFLDELPEFPRGSLEVLRQPLEDGQITISRAAGSITLPAQFMLVATQNPCPCGYAGDDLKDCVCSLSQVARYNHKVSGPLLDRIDLVVQVARVKNDSLLAGAAAESSQSVAQRVAVARQIQGHRFGSAAVTNSDLTNAQIRQFCQLDANGQRLAKQALLNLGLSARGYTRVLKVARTIADLGQQESIQPAHLAEALVYRAKA